ncbi:MAG TPA: GNAT family N-acetyltransferase [Myxococcota bacterium]|nr:GNAT family N-acetyltransferase [Myxococcota bacterium]
MECEIEIERAVGAKQLAEIQALAHAIWREHYPGIISDAQIEYMLREGYSLAALQRDVDALGIRYEGARLGAAMIGFAAHARHSEPGALMLHKLYVAAAHRGRGCARRLVASAAARAKALGCARIVLRVNKRNRSAICAYERMGFAIAGSITSDIGGGFEMDDHWMELTL